MITILTDLSFLERGKPWPPPSELKRLRTYSDHKKLFEDEHGEVYREQFGRIERVIGNFDRVVSYATVLNYQRLLSVKTADLVFGDPPKITVADDAKQSVIDKLLIDTNLFEQAYMACLDVSRYGDGLMLLSEPEGVPVINVTSPVSWFPVVDRYNLRRFKYHVFGRIYLIDPARKVYGLRVQIHDPDDPEHCEAHNYELTGKEEGFKIGAELTEKDELYLETKQHICPVYRISNLLTSDRVYGLDDYEPIDSIVSELMIRISQISKVLDKFASPSMTGPHTAMQFDEVTQAWRLKVGDYFPRNSDSDPKPEYIVWDAEMDANFKQIDLLINQLYTISEMGSAIFGDLSNKTGDVPSGSALRRLMMSPLAKARRIANRFDPVLKRIISAGAAILGVDIKAEEITVKWNDGLPADPAEDAEIANIRTGGKATLSQYTAIQRLDDMSQSDTDAELAMIRSDDIDAAVGSEEPLLEPVEA